MREDHAMTAKLIALAFVLSASASTCLAAEAPGRYSMTTVEGNVWRLDGATGAMYGLRYRLRLVREDRWLVAAVNTTKKAG